MERIDCVTVCVQAWYASVNFVSFRAFSTLSGEFHTIAIPVCRAADVADIYWEACVWIKHSARETYFRAVDCPFYFRIFWPYASRMNIFRLAGDLSHLLAILVLLWKIWKTRSCAGKLKTSFQKLNKTSFLSFFTINFSRDIYQNMAQQRGLRSLILTAF